MYGLTEAFRSTYLDPSELDRRPRSIGKAIPNQEVFVLRPDGTECEPDEPGELVHRGSLVTLGYWNNAKLTRQRFRPLAVENSGLTQELAVWSGDVVTRDSDGFLYFLGRKDQQIKTSGYRVSPTEVESVALEVPGAMEAVAVGVPDEVLGHRIILALVTENEGPADLVEAVRQYCRKHLPAFMVPSHFFVLDEIPRTANGKHDRAALQERLVALLEAEAQIAED
jgi:acyl-coenzyme A synthetase/AMP-(fatty) acid ligase